MTAKPKEDEVKAELRKLSETPVQTPSDALLGLLCDYLLGASAKTTSTRAFHHWFCSQASTTTIEAATFLIRLHAYNSARVNLWRQQLSEVLSECCECVRGFHEAKENSKSTYFGAFNEATLKAFYENFDVWELNAVLSALGKAGIVPDAETNTTRCLSNAPSAVVYHIFYNLHIFRDPCIIKILHTHTPTSVLREWPSDFPPPALFHLLLDEQPDVRHWAREQVAMCKAGPMPLSRFLPSFSAIVGTITHNVSLGGNDNGASNAFPVMKDPTALWASYATVLRFVPVELLRSSKSPKLDFRHFVIGHLHDTEQHFVEVLKCFTLLLVRIGPEAWEGEGVDYPLVVFNSVKDNPRYLEDLQGIPEARRDHWLLNWIETYLKAIGKHAVFREAFPIIMQFLCEQLQHERFKALRPAAIMIADKILLAVESDDSVTDHSFVWETMEIHVSRFVDVSFSQTYAGDVWKEARALTRTVIKVALGKDAKDICAALSCLSGTAPKSPLPPHLHIRERLWKGTYRSVQPGDSDGISMIMSTLATLAHMDDLKEPAFADRAKDASDIPKVLLAETNNALHIVRAGFTEAMTRYTDLSKPAAISDLLSRPEVVKDVTVLMLSPIEGLQEAAQGLAGSAFDVDVRLDCFRALLEHYPDATLGGIFHYLETYEIYTQVVPEACSVSKALARCLTDVIDVLCSSPGGLLLNESFLKEGVGCAIPAQLPKWWNLMTKALSAIFSKTPRWAVYFDNAEMVLWMRDALIFGRDMLAQRRVIETSALIFSDQPSIRKGKRLSRVGKKMVDDLQLVLLELTKWLRLTDEELLHQSFALLESILACFMETDIRPKPEIVQKLQKHVDDARRNDPKRIQTRLDSSRLSKLQAAISAFDEEDEIQITGYTLPQTSLKAKDKASERPKPGMQRKLTDMDNKSKTGSGIRPSATKKSISTYFTAEDQKKLDAATPVPQLTKKPRPQVADRIAAGPSWPKPKGEVKSETGSSRPATSEGSSSEDEESDEEEGGATLASLSKLQRTPQIKKPERRQVMMLDVPTTRRNPAIERMQKRDDARRIQLRLKPDITGLHKTILSWDYDHSGPSPPGDTLNLSRVPDRFSDYQHFRRVFEPLLFLECWNQLSESKEESRESYECRIGSRQFVDDWIELDVSFSESVSNKWSLSEVDVVSLQHPATRKSILGKVQNYRASPIGIQAVIRCFMRGSDPGLQPNSCWIVSKVLSLATLHREYAALVALQYYDYADTILQARLSPVSQPSPEDIRKTMNTYKVNEPQAIAIACSLKTNGFSLVQGPPGTGKTSTICGLVHAFLSQRPKPATAVNVGRSSGPADREPVKKVLLCAPSNAAIDEIAHRIKEGVSGAGRQATLPRVVRVGAVSSMNYSVRDVSLEHLIEQKLNANPELGKAQDAGSEIAKVRAELESVKKLRQQKLEEITNIHDNTIKTMALEEEIRKLNKQKVTLTHQFDKLKDKQKSDSRTLDATRRRFRTEVLQEADVICSTLSGAAYEYLEQLDFDLIIIDEAAQAIELSSLIPLKYRYSRCVMVGDPQQLPPTVKSQEACSFGYNQSLFVRLQRQRPNAVHLLSIQYRMHPDISQVPSRLFYDGRLQDGPDMATKTARPWHLHEKLGTYRFFNVTSGQEEVGGSHSFINRAECQVAVALYNRLRRDVPAFDFDFKVGIISMYRGQIFQLRRAFEQRFGSDIAGTVDFNTVDGFQGQEKDVIILSCVRAGPGVQSVGFLRDLRRMNVALTRAKSSLFVLGNVPTLERSDDTWRTIISDARTRSCLMDVDVAYFTAPSTNPKAAPKPKIPSAKVAKLESKTPVNQPPIPAGLATPQQLKAAANVPTPAMPKSIMTPTLENAADALMNTSPDPVPQAQKRQLPEDEPDVSSRNSGPSQDSKKTTQFKPMPPPKKRPKTGPSLFIPKNNKRPPH